MVDLTFTKDEDKAAIIAKELNMSKEDAQYIVDLRAHIMTKVDLVTPWKVVLTLYAMGALAGQLMEAATDSGKGSKLLDLVDILVGTAQGSYEEAREVRTKVGMVQ